ncbi:MAG: bifunctional folylpolyglutamate synthase/dihydrofolate synthase [Methylobacterium sp.]|nr:bifunctional folylpolyglutamate synthase/dihydrofolate synthase [Methylobacterium sp.]MCA3638349.1 bifunctional folylpolyglutamate synthase/dihydrofolate synthase [Methylobacterium sp.]
MRTSEAYLERFLALHPKLIDLSLGRTERLLAKLGNPEARLPPVFHVAGTNGKGSTIAFLRAMLEAAGKRVNVYTSPHLVRFHERIRLAGTLVSEAELVAAFERVEAANAGEPITFFEITTAVGFDLFARSPADALLLEVGLGGRFDSTNVIAKPAVSVITPISMDHREFLGDTLEKIAFEKAGIIKRGSPLVIAQQDERAVQVCLEVAEKLRVEALIGGQDFQAFEENGRLVYQDQDALLDLPLPRLPGRHQHGNAATAIAALRRVFGESIPVSAIETGLQNVEWPARFQRLTGALTKLAPAGSELWLDGAHNADGASVLAETLASLEERSPRPLILIMATMARKNPKELLPPFVGLVQEFYAARFDQDGARPAAELMAEARAQGLLAASAGTVEETLRFLSARDWATPPRIVIGGSLYLAGEVLAADGSLPK